MNGIIIEVCLRDSVCGDGSRQSWNFGFDISPTATSLARRIRVSYISRKGKSRVRVSDLSVGT